MGQYYKAVFLSSENKPVKTANPHDFLKDAKLMEHSWYRNGFVRMVEKNLMETPQKLVWAGDYADEEPTQDKNLY